MSEPQFLYIGAPRAGSTWLWNNLHAHPGIWVPPCKSVIYFHPRFQIYRLKKLRHFGREMVCHPDPSVRRWYRHFFCVPLPGDGWYKNLFPDGRIAGEIAEAYSSLTEAGVEKIARQMPAAKIIFTMRDPVERALSHAVLGKVRKKSKATEAVPDEIIRAHLDHPSNEARTRYSKTLDLWQKYFPQSQFHIGFYEQLQNDPEGYLRDICGFLGADYQPPWFEQTLTARINPAGLSGLSDDIKRYAADKYKDELETLSARFGSYASQWRERWEAELAVS